MFWILISSSGLEIKVIQFISLDVVKRIDFVSHPMVSISNMLEENKMLFSIAELSLCGKMRIKSKSKMGNWNRQTFQEYFLVK